LVYLDELGQQCKPFKQNTLEAFVQFYSQQVGTAGKKVYRLKERSR
jgi:hypothetical protein